MPFGYLLVDTVSEAPGVRKTLGAMVLILASGVSALSFLHRMDGAEARSAGGAPDARQLMRGSAMAAQSGTSSIRVRLTARILRSTK
jgi:hypothetical protein